MSEKKQFQKEKIERATSQKKVIIGYLRSVCSHPSAEEVYLYVKQKLPQISKGTVYRILNNLGKKGEIQSIKEDVAHFDGDISSHAHFICKICGNIYDVFDVCHECKVLRRKLKRKKGKVGEIINYQMTFYGICKKCAEK